jgi:hypothetical protein
MTLQLGEYYLSLSLRNGVGLDLEFTNSRPVWVTSSLDDSLNAASFEGTVLLVPLIIITFGKIYMEGIDE